MMNNKQDDKMTGVVMTEKEYKACLKMWADCLKHNDNGRYDQAISYAAARINQYAQEHPELD